MTAELDDVAALRQQLANSTRHAEGLHRVIEAISGELDFEPLLTRLVECAAELIRARYGTIGLVEERASGPVVRTAATYNMPPEEQGAEMSSGVGLAGVVLRDQRPLRLDRYGDLNQPTLPDLAEHTVIGVPIWWAGRMIGFFGIGTEPPRRFDDRDCETLELLARHAAVAIQNARLFEAERRRVARITAITRISRLIASSLSLYEIFRTAVEAIREHLGFSYIAASIIDPDDPEVLVLLAQTGAYAGDVPDDYQQSIHHGLVGAAARTGQRVLVNNVAEDPRYLPLTGGPRVCAELAVPIMKDGRPLGVLNIESDRPISQEDAEGIEIIADQLGVATDNATRYAEERQRTERLRLIARVGQRIAARHDASELFATIVDELHISLGYDHVALFLIDPDNPTWLVRHAQASRWPTGALPRYRQSIDRGILGAAARGRAPVLANVVVDDPRYTAAPGADELRAELAVPILQGDRLLGVLDVASMRLFHDEDATSVQIVADQLGIAIDNVQLFSGIQRSLAEKQLLYETSRHISTAMSIDEVVAAYLEQVAARGRYSCTVVLYEMDDSGARSGVVVRGFWSAQRGLRLANQRLPYTQDKLDPPLDAGQTVMISDVEADERVSETLRELQRRDGRPALAMIPLIVRGWRTGLVVLSYPEVHEWSEADLQPYQATAAQLAMAIDSRSQHLLLSERGQQLAVLEERRRLARELHDSVTQSLFSMSLLAQVVPDLWEIDQGEARSALGQIRDLTRGALAEMRALLFELRPAAMGEQELARALQHHAEIFERRSGVGVTVDIELKGTLPATIEQVFFRIAQEALSNIARHAHARQVLLSLRGTRPVRLTVADDGQGFAPHTVTEEHFGLVSMRERAASIGAQIQIDSAPGRGTSIVVEWPG